MAEQAVAGVYGIMVTIGQHLTQQTETT